MWPDHPRCSCFGPLNPCICFSSLHGRCLLLPAAAGLWGLHEAVYMLKSTRLQYKTKTKRVGVWADEYLALGFLPWKQPKLRVSNRCSKGRTAPHFLLYLYSWGLPGTWGFGGDEVGRCSVYVLYMPLPWWMTWFGLVCFPPLLLILCVLFPLCCTIRTLQWDTDPSVLQLQSDSELGYMSALLLLLLSFLCYGCVEMLELLLLLFPPLPAFVEFPVW